MNLTPISIAAIIGGILNAAIAEADDETVKQILTALRSILKSWTQFKEQSNGTFRQDVYDSNGNKIIDNTYNADKSERWPTGGTPEPPTPGP